jgi:hypothetical protein
MREDPLLRDNGGESCCFYAQRLRLKTRATAAVKFDRVCTWEEVIVIAFFNCRLVRGASAVGDCDEKLFSTVRVATLVVSPSLLRKLIVDCTPGQHSPAHSSVVAITADAVEILVLTAWCKKRVDCAAVTFLRR